MFQIAVFLGALLAAPLFSQSAEPVVREGRFVWFTLAETQSQILKRIGPPFAVADFGDDFQTWHYRLGDTDHHDYSHYLVFRRSTRKLVSVTRSYEPERVVDQWFPDASSAVYHTENNYGARVRVMSGGRVLIAMGSTKKGQPTSQVMLIARSELRNFQPWLDSQLK